MLRSHDRHTYQFALRITATPYAHAARRALSPVSPPSAKGLLSHIKLSTHKSKSVRVLRQLKLWLARSLAPKLILHLRLGYKPL